MRALSVAVRADSGAQLGSGHVMRCLALALELRKRGATVRFVCREYAGHISDRVRDAGFQVLLLPAVTGGASDRDDACETLAVLGEPFVDWVVVDHYDFDAAWEATLRCAGSKVLAIDDLANRVHSADMLLDQNYFGAATPVRYESLVAPHCRQLLGPGFALLQPAFAELASVMPARGGYRRRILVSFGGSDATNETGAALEALSQREFTDYAVDVVLGPNHPAPQAVTEAALRRAGTTVYRNPPSLAGLMARADLALGAAGSTTWERLCLRLPAVVVTAADNQVDFTRSVHEAGYVHWIGSVPRTPAEYALALSTVELNLEALPPLVDGLGARRVADAMLSIAASSSPVNTELSAFAGSPVAGDCSGEAAVAGLDLTFLTDRHSWVNNYLATPLSALVRAGHRVHWSHDSRAVSPGHLCFVLGWERLLDRDFRSRFRHTLVVHASDLPRGRGMSPLSWQILEGRREVVVTLLEAEDAADSGDIYAQERLQFEGTELLPEMHDVLGAATVRLCERAIMLFTSGDLLGRPQTGEPSSYRRRRPSDSRLDPTKTLEAQFDLLRVVDNRKYPAFFEIRGRAYELHIHPRRIADG